MTLRLFGIKISISFLFVLMLCFLLIVDATGFMSLSLFAVLIHETGHLLAMHFVGCKPREINLQFLGLLIVGTPLTSPKQQFVVTFFGPFANIVTFCLFLALYFVSKLEVLLIFAAINLILALINLLPINGLDGGTLIFILLERFFGTKAKIIYAIISLAFSMAAVAFSTFLFFKIPQNPSLLLLSIYLFAISVIKFIKE